MARRSLVASMTAAGFLAVLSGTPAWAGIRPEPFRTGLFGVAAGQSIRISILNAAEAGGVIEPCFHVWDAAGTLLLETDAGPLPAGMGTFVDFTPAPSGTPVRGRAQLRAEIVFEHGEHPPEPVHPRDRTAWLIATRRVLATLEVFDTATGQTAFTTPFATVAGIEPQPFAPVAGIDPEPFRTGLFGVGEGQSIRVSVLNAGETGGIIEPCVRVLDLAGAVLFEGDGDLLPANGGVFADFDPLPAGPTRAPGVRAQLRAEVELLPAVRPPDVAPGQAMHGTEIHLTLEVYDTATGRTAYTMPFSWVGFNPQPEPPEPVRQP